MFAKNLTDDIPGWIPVVAVAAAVGDILELLPNQLVSS
jgi:hypothetical protein